MSGRAPVRDSSRMLGLTVLVALAGVTLGALWAITSYTITGGLRHDGVWLLVVLILGVAVALAIGTWCLEIVERAEDEEAARAGS